MQCGDDRETSIAPKRFNEVEDVLLVAEVERRCRLVEQHDVGLLGERTRQHDPLTFPAGERADLTHREGAQVKSGEDVHRNAAVRVGSRPKTPRCGVRPSST